MLLADEDDSCVTIPKVLIEMVRVAKLCDKSVVWLEKCSSALAMEVDCLVWNSGSGHLTTDASRIAQPKGPKRSLRLDPDLVKHYAETVVKESSFPSAARAARSLRSICPKTALGQEEGYMALYVKSCTTAFQGVGRIFVVSDDHRASGEKTQMGAIWGWFRRSSGE